MVSSYVILLILQDITAVETYDLLFCRSICCFSFVDVVLS